MQTLLIRALSLIAAFLCLAFFALGVFNHFSAWLGIFVFIADILLIWLISGRIMPEAITSSFDKTNRS